MVDKQLPITENGRRAYRITTPESGVVRVASTLRSAPSWASPVPQKTNLAAPNTPEPGSPTTTPYYNGSFHYQPTNTPSNEPSSQHSHTTPTPNVVRISKTNRNPPHSTINWKSGIKKVQKACGEMEFLFVEKPSPPLFLILPPNISQILTEHRGTGFLICHLPFSFCHACAVS